MGHFLADRAVIADQLRRHPQHGGLGFVGIRDEAALEPAGRPGHIGDRGRDEAAGARFRRGKHQRMFRKDGTGLDGELVKQATDGHIGESLLDDAMPAQSERQSANTSRV
ncbi:hypothetical protein D3C87_1809630 [compost metagenome]